jgi:hypothetical protein
MAEDRSLKDIIRFLDPSGEISDAEIASISNSLKFSEVLDLISAVSDDKVDAGRQILSKHDPRFTVTQEAPSAFKPIAPQGTVGSLPSTANKQNQSPSAASGSSFNNPMSSGQGNNADDDTAGGELDALINDPNKKNDPNVKQIQSLLQRLQNR